MSTRSFLFGFIFITGFLSLKMAYGQSVVVSSYFNSNFNPTSTRSDEWTELLVIQDNLDMRNWNLGDNNSSQTNWMVPINFNNISFWNNLRAGTIILIWHRNQDSGGNSHYQDINRDDGHIELWANDPNYFNGGDFISNQTLNIGATGDIILLQNSSLQHVHALGHMAAPGPGSSWTALPTPKLNHFEEIVPSEAVSVCPGTNITEYGTTPPQNGTTYTSRSTTLITRGLPNQRTTNLTANSHYWRSLREPEWLSPDLSASFVTPSTINLSWNPSTNLYPDDNTQGYLILRNTLNSSFTKPADGHTYSVGDPLGDALVIADMPYSQPLPFSDNYTLSCGETIYYRVYAYRYSIDNSNLNDLDSARGRAYQTDQFGVTSVSLSAAPTISTVDHTDATCGNSDGSITITANGIAPPLEYSIDNGANWQSGSVFTGLLPGDYNVVIKDINNCQASYVLNPVIIIKMPVQPESASASPGEICEGFTGLVQLTATGGCGTVLAWYEGSCETGDMLGYGVTINIPAPAETKTYYASWEGYGFGDSPCTQVTVTVQPPPTTALAGGDQSICNNLSTTLAANDPLIGSGQWTTISGPGTVTFSDPVAPDSEIDVSDMGVYFLEWIISSGNICPESRDTVAVEFGDMINVSASYNPPICEGEELTLFSSIIAGATYSWTGPGGYTSAERNPVISAATTANSGDYIVTVTDIPGDCPATSDTITVEISSIPAAPVVNSQDISGSSQEVCAGSTVTYSIASPVAGSVYNWDLSGGGVIHTTVSSDVIEIEWTETGGSYELSVTETNPAGCNSDPFLLTVTVMPTSSPAVTINVDKNPVCAGDTVTFEAIVTNGGPAPVYSWTRNGVHIGVDNPVYILDIPSNNDFIACEITSSDLCADPATVNSNTIELIVLDSLKVSFAVDEPLCSGTPTELTPGSSFASYLWSDGSTGQSITVEDPGVYWVMVTDAAGCIGTDTIVAKPCETMLFYAPNAFSPDFDGLNDLFEVVCSNPEIVSKYEIYIYNKWGQLIYTGNDIGDGWDGTLNGSPCQVDIYTYIIIYTVTEPRNESGKIGGIVMLIR